MVALDIDGTLCVEDHVTPHESHLRIRPAVLMAIGRLVASGAHVVLSTGRPTYSVLPFVAALGLRAGTAICSNGAVLIDTVTGAVLGQTVFDVAEPVRLIRDRLPDAVFTVEEIGVGDRTTMRIREHPTFGGGLRVVDFAELVATPAPRLTVHWPGRTGLELIAALADTPLPGVQCSFALDGGYMIATGAGVTKGAALEKLRAQWDVDPADTLAVGDGNNDVEMLTWAAHGVAMGQANAAVRAAADEVCPPVTEDGLATLLSRWF
jgi:HAD superfamily hydrolase (TIGR01484 family)